MPYLVDPQDINLLVQTATLNRSISKTRTADREQPRKKKKKGVQIANHLVLDLMIANLREIPHLPPSLNFISGPEHELDIPLQFDEHIYMAPADKLVETDIEVLMY